MTGTFWGLPSRSAGSTHDISKDQEAAQNEPGVPIHLAVELLLYLPPHALEPRQCLLGDRLGLASQFVYDLLGIVYGGVELCLDSIEVLAHEALDSLGDFRLFGILFHHLRTSVSVLRTSSIMYPRHAAPR